MFIQYDTTTKEVFQTVEEKPEDKAGHIVVECTNPVFDYTYINDPEMGQLVDKEIMPNDVMKLKMLAISAAQKNYSTSTLTFVSVGITYNSDVDSKSNIIGFITSAMQAKIDADASWTRGLSDVSNAVHMFTADEFIVLSHDMETSLVANYATYAGNIATINACTTTACVYAILEA